MNKKIVWLAFAFVLLLSTVYTTIWSSGFVTTVSPRTWTVDDDGPADFHTIKEAIDGASDGDTIFVHNGTYYESIIIDKPLQMEGESKENTTVDSSGIVTSRYNIHISSSDVSLRGFNIPKAPHYTPRHGIKIGELSEPCLKNINISGNRIGNCDHGIYIFNASDLNITNNEFVDNGETCISIFSFGLRIQIIGNTMTLEEKLERSKGIEVSKSRNSLFGYNKITNIETGIHMSEGRGSTYTHNELCKCKISIIIDVAENNTIDYNQMHDNDELCISLGRALNNTISDNEIWNNFNGTGIRINSGENNTIAHNIIYNTQSGIDVSSSNYNSIRNNFIRNCSKEACRLTDSSFNGVEANVICSCYCGISATQNSRNNTICHNDFHLNEIQAYEYPEGTNHWDNGSVKEGNYWSDYEGEDQNDDGFGDTLAPHYRDRYPLIVPIQPVPVYWEQKRYDCIVLGNLTVSWLHLDKSKQLGFNITGQGYCNLTIPRDLLDGAFRVLVNGTLMDVYSLTWTTTHTSTHITYLSSTTQNVKVSAQIKTDYERADLNHDGKVDIKDLYLIAIHLGK